MNSSYAHEPEEDWQTWCPDTTSDVGIASPWFPGRDVDTSTYLIGPTSIDSNAWMYDSHSSPIQPLGSICFQNDPAYVTERWNQPFEPLNFGHFGMQRHNSSASSTGTGSVSYSSDNLFASQEVQPDHEISGYSLQAAEIPWQSRQLYGPEQVDYPMTERCKISYSQAVGMPSSIGFACDEEAQKPIRSTDPPMEIDASGGRPQRQCPRFAGDEYTPSWIRGDGTQRAGWCRLCQDWHKLKDSAYWYHMHYSHGISCATGKPFGKPEAWRPSQGTGAHEALCGNCKQWIYVGRFERGHTAYFRHAYKCQSKDKPGMVSPRKAPKGVSPGRVNKRHG